MDSKHGHRWAETVETCTINQDSSLGRKEVVCFVSLRLFCSRFIFLSIGRAFDLELFLECYSNRGFVADASLQRPISIIYNDEQRIYRRILLSFKIYPSSRFQLFTLDFPFYSRLDFRETFENTNFIAVFQSRYFKRLELKFRSLFQMLRMSFTVDAENIRSFHLYLSSCKEILKSFALN